MRLLFLFCALGIVYGSLYPWVFLDVPEAGLVRWSFAHSRGEWLDVLLNVLVYVPLGFTGMFAFGQSKFWKVILLWLFGTALSYGTEFGQLYLPGRDPNLRDVLTNSLGTLLGALTALPFKASRFQRVLHNLKIGDPAAPVLLICWIGWHCFPMLPSLRFGKLHHFIDTMSHPSFTLQEIGDSLLAGCLIAALCEAVGGWFAKPQARIWFVVFGMLLRGIIVGQSFSLCALIFTLAGVMSYSLAPGGTTKRTVAAILMLIWFIPRELYPFTFRRIQSTFMWSPFTGVLAMNRDSMTRVLLGKLFLYSGTIWMAARSGVGLAPGAILLIAVLSVGEWLQLYLPDRTPETTDMVLALAGTLLVAMLAPKRK